MNVPARFYLRTLIVTVVMINLANCGVKPTSPFGSANASNQESPLPGSSSSSTESSSSPADIPDIGPASERAYLFDLSANKLLAGKLTDGKLELVETVALPSSIRNSYGGFNRAFASFSYPYLWVSSPYSHQMTVVEIHESGLIARTKSSSNGGYGANSCSGWNVSRLGIQAFVPHPLYDFVYAIEDYCSNICSGSTSGATCHIDGGGSGVHYYSGLLRPNRLDRATLTTKSSANPVTNYYTNLYVSGGGTYLTTSGSVTDRPWIEPGGRFLYLPQKSIKIYQINSATGALENGKEVSANVHSIVASKDGSTLFAYTYRQTSDSGISAFRVESATGSLQLLGTLALSGILEAQVHPENKWIFVGTSQQIHVYEFSSGTFTLRSSVSLKGSLSGMKLDRSGRFLVATAQQDPSLTIFSVNSSTGNLVVASERATGLPTALHGVELY